MVSSRSSRTLSPRSNTPLEAPPEIEQPARGGMHVDGLIGAAQDRLRARTVAHAESRGHRRSSVRNYAVSCATSYCSESARLKVQRDRLPLCGESKQTAV